MSVSPDHIPHERWDDYRTQAAVLVFARINELVSPDDIELEAHKAKPTEVAAEHAAEQVAMYHELYPSLRETTTDDIEISNRVIAEFEADDAIPGGPAAQLFYRDIQLAAAICKQKGPFDIENIVASTDYVTLDGDLQ